MAKLVNQLLLVFLGVISLSNPASAITESQRERLDQFAQKFLEKKKSAAGYPVNQDTSLGDFYAWYMKHELYRVAMNNVGDPYKQSPYSLNTHEFEQEVVNYFAKLYGFKEGDYWGFVTASGTDGNNHGIYFGRKYLESKSSVKPIIYVSAEAHYSIKKLADVQNTELRLIKATDMGHMHTGDFEKQLDPARLALVVIAMGTTFKGAMDDQSAIRKILRAKHRGPLYIHSDAALFGGFLPFVNEEAAQLVHQQTQKFDSIVVSGHKFFGFDEPVGVFICTREAFKNLNPFDVPYLAGAVPTITTSRSALGPLKFWWKINSTSREDFQALAWNSLSNAEYLLQSLQDAGVRVWKNPYSNTLFFERPPEDVMKKYDLAPDESGPFGKIAHFVVMPHVDRKLIDRFVLDMRGWKKSVGEKDQR
jgi:histidine decarboxylase